MGGELRGEGGQGAEGTGRHEGDTKQMDAQVYTGLHEGDIRWSSTR